MTTAGTAGRGYRADPFPCVYEAEHVEHGERPRCCHCGREKALHVQPTRGTR